jgi:hypothetical protein
MPEPSTPSRHQRRAAAARTARATRTPGGRRYAPLETPDERRAAQDRATLKSAAQTGLKPAALDLSRQVEAYASDLGIDLGDQGVRDGVLLALAVAAIGRNPADGLGALTFAYATSALRREGLEETPGALRDLVGRLEAARADR